MAAATCTPTEYGYMVTGDTGAVTVSANTIRVKAMGFSGNADNAVCTLTNKVAGADANCFKFKASDTGELNAASGNFVYFGEFGVRYTGLAVTLGNGGSHLYIFLATR